MPVETLAVSPDSTVRQAVVAIERGAIGLALVTGQDGALMATLTDGDVRRALLAGLDMAASVRALLEHRPAGASARPVTAPSGTHGAELLHLMNRHGLRHIPLLDADGRVVDVALLSELSREAELPVTALVMAGGFGKRLRPLTEDTPKVMLSLGDRPVLELILDRLRVAGVRRILLSTHYKAELIEDYFGDGSAFGVELAYVREDRPLGTAGALSLLERHGEPLLVVNGDVLTKVDYRALLEYHRERQAAATVAVRSHDVTVPFGVVEADGERVTDIAEKPVVQCEIAAGIYLLQPDAWHHLPRGERIDMPDLIRQLLARGDTVVRYPLDDYWVDIGRPADYERARSDRENGAL